MARALATVALVAAASSIALAGCSSVCLSDCDNVPTVTVDGHDYGVSVIRGIHLEADDVTPYARVQRASDPSILLDDQAFTITDVDADTMLVARLKPGKSDDAGPWGDWIGLMGPGHDPDLCGYFERLGPSWCDEVPVET